MPSLGRFGPLRRDFSRVAFAEMCASTPTKSASLKLPLATLNRSLAGLPPARRNSLLGAPNADCPQYLVGSGRSGRPSSRSAARALACSRRATPEQRGAGQRSVDPPLENHCQESAFGAPIRARRGSRHASRIRFDGMKKPFVLACALALVLGGCAKSTDTSSSSTTTSTTTNASPGATTGAQSNRRGARRSASRSRTARPSSIRTWSAG